MDSRSLKAFSRRKRKNQNDLAAMAKVSRQAVSQWMKAATGPNPNVDILSSHLRGLAEGLGVRADDLLFPLPVLEDPTEVRRLETSFLWDRLYPDLLSFCIALIERDDVALARLAEVLGLFKAARIAGPTVWHRFESYKPRIRPARRTLLETVWRIHQSLI